MRAEEEGYPDEEEDVAEGQEGAVEEEDEAEEEEGDAGGGEGDADFYSKYAWLVVVAWTLGTLDGEGCYFGCRSASRLALLPDGAPVLLSGVCGMHMHMHGRHVR